MCSVLLYDIGIWIAIQIGMERKQNGDGKMKTKPNLQDAVFTFISRKPTTKDIDGSYRFVDDQGLYWGCWYVGENWRGERFVAEADPRDGLPW